MRRVVIAVFPGVELLDVTGPADVFSAASRLLGRQKVGYQVQLAAEQAGPVRTVNGIQLIAEVTWAEVAGDADTVIIPGALARKATTHWFTASLLAAQHPAIEVADDHSERIAREVARWLVMYLRRPGGQSQFSGPLSALEPRSQKIRFGSVETLYRTFRRRLACTPNEYRQRFRL